MPPLAMPTSPEITARPISARWNFAVAVALLALAIILDVFHPFGRSWSNSYILPISYAAWMLRGQLSTAVVVASNLAVFLSPMMFHPADFWQGGGLINRGFGAILGNLLIVLLCERRRYIDSLQRVNQELELRVRDRTAELQAANEILRQEVAERQKAQAEQQQLEEQLRQAHKMQAIGQLAGGVAHDFNNLLTIINGYSRMLLDRAPADSQWRQPLQEIGKAGERAAEVTQQLLAFSRKQMLTPKIVHLNQTIASAKSLLRRMLPENIRLQFDLSPEVRPILADAGQLVQVLLNLASNARDAMPAGGDFRIVTHQVTLSENPLGAADVCAGPHVRLEISDTGAGMDEATRCRIFEPFFTTKEVGKGTGLGLASVYGIITQSGGQIDVTSEPGRGTKFVIQLPCVASAHVASNEPHAKHSPLPHGCETILLVEDDGQVRELAATILRDAGYRVIEARTGREALNMATASDAPPFDLLITDVVMPEMDGPQLAVQLAALRQELKVLFVTGYSRTEPSRTTGQPEFLIEKPFDARSLLLMVRQVLQSEQASRRRANEGSPARAA